MFNLTNIFIERVNHTNIFSLIKGRMQECQMHLATSLDDDLIYEFLNELQNLGCMSNNLSYLKMNTTYDTVNLLKRLGSTFFTQLFPDTIQEYLYGMPESFLFVHVSSPLHHIPWELLYNQDHFLAERFYISRNTTNHWHRIRPSHKETVNMLVITNPAEDLPWAQKEGEQIFETLSSEIISQRLKINMLSRRNISKIQLLQTIKDYDIVHYAGHSCHESNPEESGWLLGKGKVLRVRELARAGSWPKLIFSNSCTSIPTQTKNNVVSYLYNKHNLASTFISSGVQNYISTLWKVSDSENACDFAIDFYRYIFEYYPLGNALFEARKLMRQSNYSSNLYWANYVLYGDPTLRFLSPVSSRSYDASRNRLLSRRIQDDYPQPIAKSYYQVNKLYKNSEGSREHLQALIKLFQDIVLVLASIIFSNSDYLKGKRIYKGSKGKFSLTYIVQWMYWCSDELRSSNMLLMPERLIDVLYLYQDEIKDTAKWFTNTLDKKEFDKKEFDKKEFDKKEFDKKEFDKKELDKNLNKRSITTRAISLQYFLENLLEDLRFFNNYHLLYLENKDTFLSVTSCTGHEAVQISEMAPIVKMLSEENKDKKFSSGLYCYQELSKIPLGLGKYMQYSLEDFGEIKFIF